ncbi:MAG TPA: ribosome-associated translation inhibitor RaiA [Vicinamibacterales bacterium]
MRLDITGRHVAVPPAVRQLITTRIARLERKLNDAAISAMVIVTREKYRHKVEIAVHTRGDHVLSGASEASTWNLAVSQAIEKIEQQVQKLKGRWDSRKRQAARVARDRKGTPQPDETAAPPDGPRVIRASRYPVKPMSIDDAAMQFEDGNESFLVFRNADDDSVAILYRRKDGNLGLIQP